jgi:hypothetical protein
MTKAGSEATVASKLFELMHRCSGDCNSDLIITGKRTDVNNF